MHQPVLLNEVLDLLQVKEGGTYVDGTAGCGGHTGGLLRRIGPCGRVLALDRDPRAVERLRASPAMAAKNCMVEHGNYAELGSIARRHGITGIDGLLLDLGVSSEQLDDPARGFSFMADGPLDMRMDFSRGETAADLVNGSSEQELVDMLRELGEEPRARHVAKAIVATRRAGPIETTAQLAALVAAATGGRRGRIHPATRVFQGLRIRVNQELDGLRLGLDQGLDLLRPGGRMAVIAFHSLEDRIVKRFFAVHAGRWESLQEGGRRWVGQLPEITRVTRKAVRPDAAEVRRNPRARSARLRVGERKADDGSKE